MVHVLGHERDLELEQLDKPVDLLLLDDRETVRDECDRGVFSLQLVAEIDKGRRRLKLIEEVPTVRILEPPFLNRLHAIRGVLASAFSHIDLLASHLCLDALRRLLSFFTLQVADHQQQCVENGLPQLE